MDFELVGSPPSATPKKELERLAAALELLAAALERDALGVEADFAFHRAIALAAENPYFCDLLDYLSTQIGRGVALVRGSPGGDRHIIEEIHGEHVAIFAAIAARHPEQSARPCGFI